MSRSSPLVSIVMCTYNGREFLQQQLSSLAQQDHPDLEIICSDNGSADGTAELLQQWCQQSKGRIFISFTQKGLNKNFFNAIGHTTGEYIIFCDQDDIWMPDKISKLVAFHRQNDDASMVYCLSRPFTDSLLPLGGPGGINRLTGNDIRKTLLISFTLGHNMLIKKTTLDKIPIPKNEIVAYDWWITISAMKLGNIQCLHEELTWWRQHPNNTTKLLNRGFFYKSRVAYLSQFETNILLNVKDRKWINEAKIKFVKLTHQHFSFALFCFLLKNATQIFFYKRKTDLLSKWISFIKWSFRMSHDSYSP